MAEASKIEWTDATFNPHRGCTKVSAGCANCYAETLSGRNPGTLGVWGPNGTRVVASEAMWKEPVKWNRLAGEGRLPDGSPNADGHRPRVFCASLADVFENWQGPMTNSNGTIHTTTVPGFAERPATMQDVRVRLLKLIQATPNLDWLVLTKRPANILPMLNDAWQQVDSARDSDPRNARPFAVPPNVWLGTSVENQTTADERIPHLLRVPAAVRFLSMEPLLSAVDLSDHLDHVRQGGHAGRILPGTRYEGWTPQIGWVIVGGESGHGARPMHPLWASSLRDQCQSAGVRFFFKQWGNWKPHRYMPEADWRDLYGRVEPTADNPDGMGECMVRTASLPEHPLPKGGPCDLMYDLGKKSAGRLLDGREWSEFPEVVCPSASS